MTLALPGVDLAMRPPEEAKRQAELGQWFTPPWLANELVALLDVRNCVVLEPSAGDGNIVAALLVAGARRVIAIELDPRMVAKLRKRFARQPVTVIQGDFLTTWIDVSMIDAIAANPPYDKGADTDHLARVADLLNTGVSEAALLLRTVALHSGERADGVWSRLDVMEMVAVADRVSFAPAGDESAAEPGKIDVSLFRVSRHVPHARPAVRWVRDPLKGGR